MQKTKKINISRKFSKVGEGTKCKFMKPSKDLIVYIVVKLNERTARVSEEWKKQPIYEGTPIRLLSHLSMETIQARGMTINSLRDKDISQKYYRV